MLGIKETALIPSTPFARQAPRKRLLDHLSEPSSIKDRYVWYLYCVFQWKWIKQWQNIVATWITTCANSFAVKEVYKDRKFFQLYTIQETKKLDQGGQQVWESVVRRLRSTRDFKVLCWKFSWQNCAESSFLSDTHMILYLKQIKLLPGIVLCQETNMWLES